MIRYWLILNMMPLYKYYKELLEYIGNKYKKSDEYRNSLSKNNIEKWEWYK